MKLRFTQPELQWIDANINRLFDITLKYRGEGYEQVARTAKKMKYKFTGTPPYVFLTGKERALVTRIALTRFESLQDRITAERDIVKGILRTIYDKERA